ncbi:hypothetical protein QCD60_09455 [Pokkaliibacter sp. MBI-7]|uniref:hypothetical protein n=1 Tax=Pokkaliibacter sp. MBI-7 TaxID=3040600 RepID=UPI002446E8BC|nr:hypothetical protein [Pokkaliibacter sp. MBI-7]MDH2432793.1 hypothetical protein [Pokkaliibacter sp. MBI-7]
MVRLVAVPTVILSGMLAFCSTQARALPLPNPSAEFSGLAQISQGKGYYYIKVYASRDRLRLELPPLGDSQGQGTVMILNFASTQGWIFSVGPSLSKEEMKTTPLDLTMAQSLIPPVLINSGQLEGNSSNTRMVAGEPCINWQLTTANRQPVTTPINACLSYDGAVMRNRIGANVVYEMIRFQRGEQPDSLFTLPSGYEMDAERKNLDSFRGQR